MTKHFHAVSKGLVGDGTVGDLVDWLEKFVNVVFPENGIEYFHDNKHRGPEALKRFQMVPVAQCGEEDVHHIACYVHRGSCEGQIIEVNLRLRDGSMKSLTWAKAFGPADDCWRIAAAVSEALESIILFQEVPEIVGMAKKLPMAHWHSRETSLRESVKVASTESTLSLTTESGIVIDSQNWSDEGQNAKFHVQPRLSDWITVLTNLKASFHQAILN